MATFTERLKQKGVSNGSLSFTERVNKRRSEDTAEAARRSKMGTIRNTTPLSDHFEEKLAPKLDTQAIDMFKPKAKSTLDPSVNNFVAGLQAKESGLQPQMRTTFRQPTEQELKSPMVQFASGAYEGSNIARGVTALQKMSGNSEPLAAKLARESAPQSSGWRTAGKVYGSGFENAALYGTVGKAAEGWKALEGIKSPFLRNLAGQQLADTVIQTPSVIMQGAADKKSIGGIAKDVGLQQAQDLGANLLFGTVGEIFKKLKAKKSLTQVEIETVNATPELRALPEAKQYLMLPEGKITTPDVIEALPPRPTLDDLDALKRKPSNAPMNKNYPNLESMDAADLKALSSELATNKENLINEQIKWLKETSGNGVEQGKLFRDDMGEVVGRQGRISKNDRWYQEWAKENNYRNLRNSDLREVAEKQLREGYNSSNGHVPPDENFIFADEFAKNADIELNSPARHGEALNKAKQYLEAKDNLAYNVPEQFRKETPFTVSRSTVPPKVEGKYAKESLDPLGGKLPKAEPKPIGGELPKQKMDGIPLGEKPLSFPQTVAKSDLAADELKQMIKDNPLSHKPVNNPDTLKYAQEIVDQNFEAAKRVVKEGDTFQNATESAMAQDIIRRLQNNKQWDEAFEVMEATARKAKTSGQTIQAFSMWRRMTPEGMLRYADKVIKDTGTKMSAEFADKLTEAMKRIEAATDENTLKNTIMRQAGEMPEWAYKSMNSKTADQLKDIAMAQVLSDIADQVPKSAWKKASTVQAMSHLINVKTAARNVLGNLTFGTAEKISNAIAMPFDAIGSLFTGKRTLTMPKLKGTFKAGFDKAKDAAFDASMGIDRTGVSAGKYNVPLGSSFKSKLGKAGEKALKYELNVPDEFFKGQIYDDVLKQQMAAAKVTEATQDMMEYATMRAKYATFQDDSLPAKLLQGLKDLTNKIGGGAKIRGKSGLMTREFGLGDFLIKYTTVPGNLIARGIEYTPAGLFKILSIAKDANLSGAMKQSEIAMTIGRSIAGTSMIAMGAALRRKGLIISADDDRGKNAQSLDQAEGLGNYKVNISAVERMLNGEDTTPQDGDELYSYNWIEPLGVQLAVGAEVDKEMQKQGTVPEIVFNAGNAAIEEILDLPTLSVIRQMTYQDNAFDVAITPLVQGISGFVPSPIRQYAQMQDPTSRLTKGEGWQEKITNRLKSSLPTVGGFEGRKGLEPKIDPFGREVQYPGGAFNNLINPGQTSTYRPSEVTPQLKQLEDLTAQTDFYPRASAPAYFEHNKERINLTPEEKTAYMKMEGEEVLRRYKEILAKGVSNANAEAQRKELNKAKDKASKMAREEILKRRGLK